MLSPQRPCGGLSFLGEPRERHGHTQSQCGQFSGAGEEFPTLRRTDALFGLGVKDWEMHVSKFSAVGPIEECINHCLHPKPKW